MSIGVIGHARAGLIVAEDPDDPEARVLAMAKINCGATQASARFALKPVGDVCRIHWLGSSSRDGDFYIGNILVCHLRCNKIKGKLTSHEFLHLAAFPARFPARRRQGRAHPSLCRRPIHATQVAATDPTW